MNALKGYSLATASIIALLCATAAAAQPGAASRWAGAPPMTVMDRDGDGLVSADEFALHRAERIAARAAEGRMLRNAGNAPVFEDWDLNADGLLSAAELDSGRQARFAARGAARGGAYGPGAGPGAGRPCPRRP